ncbi:arabinan endo-1,5-alpha-L-arabinosidase [Terriglobus albidus]|uniref:arabinan endo-1,5-alpha-L-arabinosidase n=1 Tax=Terriglobus albidus TaxID=1592106 RepID=UPI0021E085E8|nr:arabinan endo-1,5-alpha-L-arabinosidase [Terriglobus albidus]
MSPLRRVLALCALSVFSALLASCGSGVRASGIATNPLSYGDQPAIASGQTSVSGDIAPVRDPSVIYAGGTYYLFVTDAAGAWNGSLPFLCSSDRAVWRYCGSVFPAVPEWLHAKLPGLTEIWAPDISYFNGEYHVYYSASIVNTTRTVIGLATNVTLDAQDPRYHWVDRGMVTESFAGAEINDLDPNVLVDGDRVWLSYGSYWDGIRQREIDPATGMLKPGQVHEMAARPWVAVHPIEGSSQLWHDGWYYLFVSIDRCCNADITTNNYKMAVGRSKSPNGPFLAKDGTLMMDGGSTVILEGSGQWVGVGGGTVYDDPGTGKTMIVFHGQKITEGGRATLWIKEVSWVDGWPVIH